MRAARMSLRGGALVLLLAWVASARQIPLRDQAMAGTAEGRQLLKYLVGCALPEGDTVSVAADGDTFRFAGSIGWTPAWISSPLTEPEQRRLSACLLARTNFFGKPVRLSLRSDAPDAPQELRTTASERRDYPFFEGGFFGNIFTANPVGYVCLGDTSQGRQGHLEQLFRVCTLPKDNDPTLSRCDFRLVGLCKDKAFLQDGIDYSEELLQVYLPGAPGQNPDVPANGARPSAGKKHPKSSAPRSSGTDTGGSPRRERGGR